MDRARTNARVIGIVAAVAAIALLAVIVSLSRNASAYTPHATIAINSNADFTAENGVTGGSGTWDDPYMIEGWEIDASTATGIAIQNTDKHFIIKNVYVHSGGTAHHGITFTLVTDGAIDNATISDNLDGIRFNSAIKANITSNTVYDNAANGIYIYAGSGDSKNVLVASNDVYGNSYHGIYLSSTENAEMSSNDVYGNTYDGIYVYYVFSELTTVIDSNYVGNNVMNGIHLWRCVYFDITNNDVSGNQQYGVYLDATEYVNIVSNDVSGNGQSGVRLRQSYDASITSNTLTSNNGGISLSYSTYGDIASNTLSGNNGGISLAFNSDNADITSNDISGSGVGIMVFSSKNTNVADNTVSQGGGYGVWLGTSYGILANDNTVITSNIISQKWDGIHVEASTQVDITSNTISDSSNCGIYLSPPLIDPASTKISITSNTISGASGDGIYIGSSSTYIETTTNTISGSRDGIYVGSSTAAIDISSNTISDNSRYGIHLYSSNNINITANEIGNNGIFLEGTSVTHFNSHEITSDNIVNGLPVRYSKDCSNLVIDGISVGQLLIVNCTNVRVTNVAIAHTDAGIEMAFVDDALVARTILADNSYGMYVRLSTYATLTFNNISDSSQVGIYLDSTTGASVHHNNFVDNAIQAKDNNGPENAWDNGYPSGGNYWSDYTGVDQYSGPNQNEPGSDGIGDTPYTIDSYSKDRYPLMTPAPMDQDPPTVEITSPPDGKWVNATTVTVFGTASDGVGVYRVEVSCNGGAAWKKASGTASWTYNCVGLSEGSNTIMARAIDFAGRVSTYDVITVNVDLVAPTVAIASPTDGQWFNVTTATTSGTAADSGGSGLDRIEVSCDGGATWHVATGTATWTYDCTELAEGTNAIRARAFDIAGSQSAHDTITVNIDLTPPTVIPGYPPDGAWFNTTTATISGTAYDGGSGLKRVEMSCDGGATWHEATGTFSWTYECEGLIEGANAIRARAFDLAGWESTHDTKTVNVDLTPPLVTITSPPDGVWINATTVIMSGTAYDGWSGVDKVEVSCDGGATWHVATGTAGWTYDCAGLMEGANAIRARAIDLVGWESAPDSMTVNVDLTAPTMAIASPPDGAWTNTTSVIVSGIAFDGGSGLDSVEISCDGGSTWNLATGTTTWTYVCTISPGANDIHARAFDFAAWESTLDAITLNYDPSAPTLAILSPPDGQWFNVTTATTSGTAADSGGSGLDRIEVSCDGGATWHVATGTATWMYDCVGLAEGANVVRARAFDVAGSESAHEVITVNVDITPPSVTINSPPDGKWIGITSAMILGTAADAGGSGISHVEVSCDAGGSWHVASGTATWTYDCTILIEGANEIHVRAFDFVGLGSSQEIIILKVDLAVPATTITSPLDGQWIGAASAAVSGDASDIGGSGLDRVEVSCDNGTAWHVATGTVAWTYDCVGFIEGQYIVRARAFDTAGGESIHSVISLNVDPTVPSVTIMSPSDGEWIRTATSSIRGTSSDFNGSGIDRVEVSCDNGTSWNIAAGTASWTFECTSLAQGPNGIHARAFDLVGGASIHNVAFVNVDTTPPTVAIASPTDEDWGNASTVTIAGTSNDGGSGLGRVEVSCDGGSMWNRATGTSSWTYLCSLTPGANDVKARAYDLLDWESAHDLITLYYDPTPPIVTIMSPTDGKWIPNATITIYGTANDEGGSGLVHVEVSCDGGAAWHTATGTATWTYDCAGLSAGLNTVYARAFDAVHLESVHDKITLRVDLASPAITITSPAGNSWFNTAVVAILGTASDSASGIDRIEVSCDNGVTWSIASGTVTWVHSCVVLAEGATVVHARAFDISGRESSRLTVTIYVDLTPPEVAFGSPANDMTTGLSIQAISGVAMDNLGLAVVKVRVGAGEWVGAEGTASWSLDATLFPGYNLIEAMALDLAGNPSAAVVIQIFYDNENPSMILACSKSSVEVGDIVSCAAAASDNRGTPTLSWTVKKGDVNVTSGIGNGITFAASEEGDYVVVAIAADEVGNTATASSTVTAKSVPRQDQGTALWLVVSPAAIILALLLLLFLMRRRKNEARALEKGQPGKSTVENEKEELDQPS